MTLYAAYGSNLDPRQMLLRAPHSPHRGTGWLRGWRLTFGGEEIGWEGAVATLAEDPDHSVFVSIYDLTVADENALRERRAQVEGELDKVRRREEELDAQSAFESPLLIKAQENFYSLSALREKFRGTQSLAQERSRFLAEEAEEARASGRDPDALEAEAKVLRNEESVLQN